MPRAGESCWTALCTCENCSSANSPFGETYHLGPHFLRGTTAYCVKFIVVLLLFSLWRPCTSIVSLKTSFWFFFHVCLPPGVFPASWRSPCAYFCFARSKICRVNKLQRVKQSFQFRPPLPRFLSCQLCWMFCYLLAIGPSVMPHWTFFHATCDT